MFVKIHILITLCKNNFMKYIILLYDDQNCLLIALLKKNFDFDLVNSFF